MPQCLLAMTGCRTHEMFTIWLPRKDLHNDLTSYHVTVHGGQYIRPCPYLSQSVPAAGGRMSISNDKLSIVSSNHKRSAGNPCTYQHHSMNPEGTVCLVCVCVCVCNLCKSFTLKDLWCSCSTQARCGPALHIRAGSAAV